MIRLQVTEYKGEPLSEPFGAEFNEFGGSIGRGDGNTLILPDPQRHISRNQASVTFEQGSYLLGDSGRATPTYLNGEPIGSGNKHALRHGDEVRIGEYTLRVLAEELPAGSGTDGEPAIVDPFADLDTPAVHDPRRYSPSPTRDTQPEDPFARSPGSGMQQGHRNLIPDDFEPFGEPPVQSGRGAGAPEAEGPGFSTAENANISKLFELDQSAPWDPFTPENPFGNSPQSPGNQEADRSVFGAPKAPPRAPTSNHAPPLSTAFSRPQARAEPAGRNAQARPAAGSPTGEGSSRTGPIVVTWEPSPSTDTEDEIKREVVPSPRSHSAPAAPQPAHISPRPPRQAAAPAAPAAGAPLDERAQRELLDAFLAGAGLPELQLKDGLTPDFMKLVGQLLHEAIDGTLQLLLARALTKREVRAEATVIVARENNPLKFSPNAEAALVHLLAPHTPAYMKPVDAMRDAYGDLRTHQFGIMAGMRAALLGVLARLNPQQLEDRLTDKGAFGSLIPASRKARLWELYEQLYSDISTEAQDDFQTLFGRAFLKAYQEQVSKLETQDGDAKR